MNDMDQLIERYLQGTSTEEEELLLRRLMASSKETDGQHTDVRAMMSYFAVRRARQQRLCSRNTLQRIAAVAAAICLVAGAGLLLTRHHASGTEDECYAHIHGKYITTPSVVQQEMEKDMANIFAE